MFWQNEDGSFDIKAEPVRTNRSTQHWIEVPGHARSTKYYNSYFDQTAEIWNPSGTCLPRKAFGGDCEQERRLDETGKNQHQNIFGEVYTPCYLKDDLLYKV